MVMNYTDISSQEPLFDVVTVTLNAAIDRTVVIPNFTAGAVNRGEISSDSAGGKGVNVAAALADYGLRVAASGFLGRDNCGPFHTLFARKQITDEFLQLPGETRVGIKIVDPARRETTDINFPGLTPSDADIEAILRKIESLHAPWFVLAGSLPPKTDQGMYCELIASLKARGVRVALDTSGMALTSSLAVSPTLVKPNIYELSAYVGKALKTVDDIVSAARRLVSDGIELVAVSMGADGACFVTADEAVLAQPPAVAVVTTVGAGDAMVAGLVVAQLRGKDLQESARIATSFSVRAVTKPSPDALFDTKSVDAWNSSITTAVVEHPVR